MPKETFFNLADEKRAMIEAVATDEFVAYGFDKASINRIIEQCGIAKGSFYQYFQNKTDVFVHLMNRAGEKKLEYMSSTMANPEGVDFFTLLKEMYISGLRFAHENPKQVAIGNQLLKNKNHPVYEEVLGDGNKQADILFRHLIQQAIDRGEIRSDIDIGFTSYIISNMNVATIEYYYDVVRDTPDAMMNWDEDIMETVNKFIDFLKNGIACPTFSES